MPVKGCIFPGMHRPPRPAPGPRPANLVREPFPPGPASAVEAPSETANGDQESRLPPPAGLDAALDPRSPFFPPGDGPIDPRDAS